jgi:SulP family sulfate permease
MISVSTYRDPWFGNIRADLWSGFVVRLQPCRSFSLMHLAVAVVGLLESLVDDLPDTTYSQDQESIGQELASTTSGFIGGMAGCAMIGQSMINVKSGGRRRLSCGFVGVALLIFCVALADWVSQILMPALVAIMIMVSVGTFFSWSSNKALRMHPGPHPS